MKILNRVTNVVAVVTAMVGASLAAAQGVSMGNGSQNWITVDDVTREDSILTFSEVRIDGNGWLVIHPFENGVPNGDKYIAATYLKSGKNSDVAIDVIKGLAPGEMFIVMLHRDSNENGVLDFIFVDDDNVLDLAVFEGSTMIGHAVATP
jgi:hypothetical protein